MLLRLIGRFVVLVLVFILGKERLKELRSKEHTKGYAKRKEDVNREVL